MRRKAGTDLLILENSLIVILDEQPVARDPTVLMPLTMPQNTACL
jgi:hypothetical protein